MAANEKESNSFVNERTYGKKKMNSNVSLRGCVSVTVYIHAYLCVYARVSVFISTRLHVYIHVYLGVECSMDYLVV